MFSDEATRKDDALFGVRGAGKARKLIQKISQFSIEELSNPAAKDYIESTLSEYDPRTLLQFPLINEDGVPIPISFPKGKDIRLISFPHKPFAEDLVDGIKNETREWVENYPQKLRWQHDSFVLRPVKKTDVESYENKKLLGEGVFTKIDIPRGTVVGIFGGMIFMQKPDEFEKLHNLLGPLATKHTVGVVMSREPFDQTETAIIIGHSLTKKFNTRFKKELPKEFRDIPEFHSENYDTIKNNLTQFYACVETSMPDSDQSDSSSLEHQGEASKRGRSDKTFGIEPIDAQIPALSHGDSGAKTQMDMCFFYANRDIKADEQLCYEYGNPLRTLGQQQDSMKTRLRKFVSQATSMKRIQRLKSRFSSRSESEAVTPKEQAKGQTQEIRREPLPLSAQRVVLEAGPEGKGKTADRSGRPPSQGREGRP